MRRLRAGTIEKLIALGLVLAGCGEDKRDFDSGQKATDGGGPSSTLAPDGGTYESQTEQGGSSQHTGTSEDASTSDRDPSGTGTSSGDGESATSRGGDSTQTSDSLVETSTPAASTNGSDTDTTASTTSVDSSSDGLATGDTDNSPTVSVTLAGDGALVGFAATATATAVSSDATAVTYTWTLGSKPADSTLANGDLTAGEASVNFFPDVAGDYTVHLKAESASGAITEDEIVLNAWAYDVGYLSVAGDQDSWTRAGFMVRSDGKRSRQVGCFFSSTATSENDWLGGFRSEGQLALMPYLPRKAELAARIAYNHEPTAGEVRMYIAGPDNDCDAALPPDVPGGSFPSFAPSGGRVSVMRSVSATSGETTTVTYAITTYGVDGSSPRDVRSGAESSIYGATWVDDETLVWVETRDSVTRAYRAKDVDEAFTNDLLTETILDCSKATAPIQGIHHVVERGDSLFVGSAQFSLTSTSTYYVWRLGKSEGGTYDCDEAAPTTHLLTDANAHDFDVAPDGSKLLYFAYLDATETEPSSSRLYLVDLVGDADPIVLAGDASTVASGAHFAANGRQVVWTETRQVFASYETTTYERPAESRVRVANSDGSRPRTLVRVSSNDSQARMLHTGGNAFCSIGAPGAPTVLGGGAVLALAGLTLRRRRRRPPSR